MDKPTFLDTDILIDIRRGYLPAIEWLETLEDVPAILFIVEMELIQGCRNKTEIERMEQLLLPVQVVYPTESECIVAVEIFKQLYLSHGLGLLDALIGASVINREAVLYTFNVKHYRHIPGINLQQPYVR